MTSRPSFGITKEIAERYQAARARFLQTQQPSTASSGPTMGTPPGQPAPGANGSPSSSGGLKPVGNGGTGDLLERLAYLALAGGAGASPNSPPLVTYTTEASPTGDVIRATPEFRDWFDRQYGTTRDEVRRSPALSVAPDRPSPRAHFKPKALRLAG